MTKEQYEGAPELIFYCEYDPDKFEDRLEIPFTNEYEIKLDFSHDEETKEIRLNVDLQPKESNIPKDFFGKNILNVTAIAGKNGVGKTKSLNTIDAGMEEAYNTLNIQYYKNIANNSFVLFKQKNQFSIHFVSTWFNCDIEVNLSILGYERDFNRLGSQKSLLIGNNYSMKMPLFSNQLDFILNKDTEKFFSLNIKQKRKATFELNIAEPLQYDARHYFNGKRKEEGFGRIHSDIMQIVDDINNKINLINTDYLFGSTDDDQSKRNKFIDLYCLTILKKLFSIVLNKQLVNSLEELHKWKYELEDFRERLINTFPLFFSHSGAHDNFEKINIEYLTRILAVYTEIEVPFYVYNHIDISNCIVSLWGILGALNNNFFISNNKISIPIDESNLEDIYGILFLLDRFVHNSSDIKDIIKFSFGGFSAGENSLITHFVQITSHLSSANSVGKIFILIDEYEQHLHPEWSRKYLSYLLKFLDAEGERLGIKFQVVLTTHSPYLISDLPKENIILLEKNEETGKRTARKSKYGFASNYYDIMSDSFFLDDTIGEFAKQKINGCIQTINRISDDLDKLINGELILDDGLSLFVEDSLKTIEEQNKIIDLVGDKFIQKQLQQLSDSVKQRLLAHSDDSVRKQQIEQDIAELEEKIRQKRMELKND